MSGAAPRLRAPVCRRTGRRARSLLRRTEVRFHLAGAGLLAVAVCFQYFASELQAKTRGRWAPFESRRKGGDAEEIDWDSIDLRRRSFAMYLPQKGSLHYASLGNDGLAADSVWIKSAGYVNREWKHKGRKFEWLDKLYNTVVDLDPHWEGAARLGATLLAALGKRPSASLRLLEKGMAANPDSWRLPYEAGIVCLLSPGRAKDALRYFRMALQRPGHLEVIKQIMPRIMAEAGRVDLAIIHARELAIRFEAAKGLLRELCARRFERLLGEAVEEFRGRHGRLPGAFAEFRRAGLMKSFDLAWAEEFVLFKEDRERLVVLYALHKKASPNGLPAEDVKRIVSSGFLNEMVLRGLYPAPERADPLGKPWLYHAPTGTVRSEGFAGIVVRQTLAVLQIASSKFWRDKGGWARSLGEFAAYFGRRITLGKTMPMEWAEVMKGGRPPVHPLAAWGERYVYDPETGKVEASWESGSGEE